MLSLLFTSDEHPPHPPTAPMLSCNLQLSLALSPTNGFCNSFKGQERCAHTLIWSIMSCFCAYKREQSGHLKTDTFWFSMCWSKWRYSRVCRVNTVSHMEHLYIILQQRSTRSVSQPASLRQRNCCFSSHLKNSGDRSSGNT